MSARLQIIRALTRFDDFSKDGGSEEELTFAFIDTADIGVVVDALTDYYIWEDHTKPVAPDVLRSLIAHYNDRASNYISLKIAPGVTAAWILCDLWNCKTYAWQEDQRHYIISWSTTA